jgi:tRNA pseudouridine55 synthase
MTGVLVIDKPAGITSHDVVAQARRIVRERRIGHTGTLDPFATGVLVLLVGRATRLAQYVASEKEYEAVIRLGYATETGDASGKPISDALQLSAEMRTNEKVEKALTQLRGVISQVPPMYSAKKIRGRKLYELARRGESVAREAAGVTVYAFEALGKGSELLKVNPDKTLDLKVRVVCSAGTYVRTLAEDFGRLLGVGAHLAELRRIRAGDFKVRDAATLEKLKQAVDESLLATILLPPEAALSRLPFLHLSRQDAQHARQGMAISSPASEWTEGDNVALFDENHRLIGVASYGGENLLRPRVVIADN